MKSFDSKRFQILFLVENFFNSYNVENRFELFQNYKNVFYDGSNLNGLK